MSCGLSALPSSSRTSRTFSFTGGAHSNQQGAGDKRGDDAGVSSSSFAAAAAAAASGADSVSGISSGSHSVKPNGPGGNGVGEDGALAREGGVSAALIADIGNRNFVSSGAVGGTTSSSSSGGSGGRGRGVGGDGVSEQRQVDDRLQRPVRKLVRERNGIRVLVGLLKYRRRAAAADAVRLRAALCLLGLAYDGQIAQVGLVKL